MKIIASFTSLLILLSFTSCGSDDETPTPVLSTIEIISPKSSIDVGGTLQFNLTGFDQSENELEISELINWSASSGSIDSDGRLSATEAGDIEITAMVGEISDSYVVRAIDRSIPLQEIYVSDAANFNNGGNYKVIRYDIDGGNPKVIVDTNLAWPQDIIILEDEEVLLVSNLSSNNIGKFDINNGEYLGIFASGISGPTRMKIGPDGLLYVLQWNGGPVLRYGLDGSSKSDFTSVSINNAIGMDWDVNGNFYVSSFNGQSVRKFDSSGNDMGILISTGLEGPTDVWFDANGDMLVNDWSAGATRRYDVDGTFLGSFTSNISNPEGIAQLPDRNIVIGNGGGSSVNLYSPEGVFISRLVSAGSGGLRTPNAITVRTIN